MATLDNLVFTREHFPIVLQEATGHGGQKFWDFNRIELPPYHPSMAHDGINFRLVPELLQEVVDGTVRDLEEIADKRSDVQAILKGLVKNARTGIVEFEPQVVEQNDLGITIESVPLVGRFYVGANKINPYGYNGDQGITMSPDIAAKSFRVPEKVVFTPELMREYEMTDAGSFLGKRQIESPHLWYRHNLGTINAIFYRNLIIALDNATVKQKYQENTQEHPILSQYKAILSNAIMRGANPTDAKASFEFVAACLDPNTPSHLLSLHQIARETFKYFHQVEPQDQARLEEIADQVDRVLRERGYREDILTYQEHTLLGSTVWIKYAEQPHTPIGIVTGKLSVDEANKARQLSKIHSAFGHFFGASENLVPISLELLDANGITMRDPQLLNKNLEYVTAKQ